MVLRENQKEHAGSYKKHTQMAFKGTPIFIYTKGIPLAPPSVEGSGVGSKQWQTPPASTKVPFGTGEFRGGGDSDMHF